MKHTVLGAGGSIGSALAEELVRSGQAVRLVARSTHLMNGTEFVRGDLTSSHDTVEGVRGSDIVYLCVGLPYDSKTWAELWPKIMQNVIDACTSVNAKLIFVDNVYMYGKVEGKMTEDTPYKPRSKKGEIRGRVATMLQNEMKSGNIQAIIARAADIYGPYAKGTSLPYMFVIEKLMNGKKAKCLVDADKVHSYTYTLDAGKGLFLLASRNEAFNQVWHLPTFSPPIDGKSFVQLVASKLGVRPRYTVMKKWMVGLGGLFNKTASEYTEMLYQCEFDYHFDSSKFNDYFGYAPKTYEEGIAETIERLRRAN
jgi:nucleoside-diphosphate-sugar epimerase